MSNLKIHGPRNVEIGWVASGPLQLLATCSPAPRVATAARDNGVQRHGTTPCGHSGRRGCRIGCRPWNSEPGWWEFFQSELRQKQIFWYFLLINIVLQNLTNSCLGASVIFNVCQDDKDSNSFRQDSDVVEFLYFYRLPALGGRFSIKQEMSQHINHCTLREVINTYWVHWIISGDMSEILSKNLWTHHLPLSLHRVDWW